MEFKAAYHVEIDIGEDDSAVHLYGRAVQDVAHPIPENRVHREPRDDYYLLVMDVAQAFAGNELIARPEFDDIGDRVPALEAGNSAGHASVELQREGPRRKPTLGRSGRGGKVRRAFLE